MTPNDGIARRVRAAPENERRINLHCHPLKVSVVDDAVVLDGEVDSIAAKKLALRDAPGEWTGDIAVGVDDGVVTPEGHVLSLSHRRFVGVLAWWTRGTRDVVNLLDVVPGEDDNDAEIVDALRIVLEADPSIASDQVTASCRDRVVTLDGFVPTEEQRTRAEFDAWALDGVEDVVNRIVVAGAS